MYSFYHKQLKLTFTHRLCAVAVLAVTLHLSFPQYSHAAVPVETERADFSNAFIIAMMRAQSAMISAPPAPLVYADAHSGEAVKEHAAPRRILWVLVTAYSSTEDQTDGSPYITASNTFVRDGVVATNFLPFRTRLRMPQHFGDKEFVVEDRMHERFSQRIDIWMPTREAAKQWGARWVKVEVL